MIIMSDFHDWLEDLVSNLEITNDFGTQVEYKGTTFEDKQDKRYQDIIDKHVRRRMESAEEYDIQTCILADGVPPEKLKGTLVVRDNPLLKECEALGRMSQKERDRVLYGEWDPKVTVNLESDKINQVELGRDLDTARNTLIGG